MTAEPPRRSWAYRHRWALTAVAAVVLIEGITGQFVARPNRILHPSRDPDLVYENTPGSWLGHAKYDVWRAPLYMVLDLLYTGPSEHVERAPPGYTLYRIDRDGCRADSTGPLAPRDEVLVLGSSQAFGMLVPQERTYPHALESSLRTRGFAGLHVGNCGVIGHHFTQSLRTAEVLRAPKQPRLNVVLVRPWHLLEQFDYTQVLAPRNPALKALIDHSNTARLAYYVYRRQRDQFEALPVPTAVLAARLDRYAAAMSASGVRSVFFLLDADDDQHGDLGRVEALLRERSLPVERFHAPADRPDLYIDHDRHWSPQGAAWAAEQTVTAIERELRTAGVTQR